MVTSAALLASIPPPPFSEIPIGPLTLHVYGLVLGIAIITAVLLLERTLPRVGGRPEDAMAIAIPAVVAGVVGARLYHVLSEPRRYWDSPGEVIAIWNGGLGIYGGVALGMVVGMWVARRRGLVPIRAADAAVVSIALAQSIGRWGNYFNEELYGGPTDLPWGLQLAGQAGTVHPTFLYESLWNLGVAGLLYLLLVRWTSRPDGALVATYFLAYSSGRFWVEGLRVDAANEWLALRQNEWVALAIATVAAIALVTLVLRARARASHTPT